MIALTKEKREELIKDCELDLKSLANLSEDFPEIKSYQSALLRQRIVLAALMADIAGYIFRDGNQFYRHPSSTMNMAISQGEDAIALFTAPPVPDIADKRAITPDFDNIALEAAKGIMLDVNRLDNFLGGEVQLLARIQCRINDALRLAAPVPEIKLPEEADPFDHEQSEYGCGCVTGWDDCLKEIKRLNGLSE